MSSSVPSPLRVALDWTPNTNHSGFYVALAKDFFLKHGLQAPVQLISADIDNYTLTPAGRIFAGHAELACAPTETCLAYAPRLTAIAALLQRDTSSIATLKTSDIKSPRDLDGRSYASYGARYEDGIVKALIKRAGGEGTINSYTPPKLDCFDEVLRGTAAATWIFEAHEGVMAKRSGVELTSFRLADGDIPYGYSPLLLAKPEILASRGNEVKAFLAAVAEGFEFAATNPDQAADILREASGHASLVDAEFVKESQGVIAPAYLNGAGKWGVQEEKVWDEFLKFLEGEKLLVGRDGAEGRPKISELFTNEYLPK